jgi:hypothetical protein
MEFYGLEMAEKYITHKKDEKSPGYAGSSKWPSEIAQKTNCLERREAEVQLRRKILPRTPVNRARRRAEA